MTESPGPPHEIELELLGPTPRRVTYSPEALFGWRLAWNLLPAILCLVYLIGSRNIAWLSNLQAHGRSIDAYVTSVERASEVGHGGPYVIDYAAKKDATRADGNFVLVNESKAPPLVGAHFQVTYLDDNPTEYYLGIVDSATIAERRNLWLTASFGLVIVYLGGLWALYAFCEARRALLASGTPVVATVIEHRFESNPYGTAYCLRYRFRHPLGKTYSREIRISQEEYDSLPDGSQFTVLVSKTDMLASELYFRFSLFQIAR